MPGTTNSRLSMMRVRDRLLSYRHAYRHMPIVLAVQLGRYGLGRVMAGHVKRTQPPILGVLGRVDMVRTPKAEARLKSAMDWGTKRR